MMNELQVIDKNKLRTPQPALPGLSVDWWIFVFIWPFGALIKALRNFRSPHAKTVFWLFCVYFGFTFMYGDPYSIGGADSTRYAAELIYAHKHWNSIEYVFSMLYNPDYGVTDIYQPLATWFVALFTDDPRWLFTLFAAVFGFFYTQNLWLIFSKIERNTKINFTLFLFILGFGIILPIWQINGVRMWTATHIFVYGVLMLYLNQNKKGYFWVFVTPLFHFSFFFPIILLLGFRYVPKNLTFLIFFYFATTLVSEINLNFVKQSLSFLPNVFQYKVEAYTNENYAVAVSSAGQQLAWHVRYATTGGKYILFFWVLMLYLNRNAWIKKLPYVERLFALALFLGGIAQIASLVPSGFRYIAIAGLLFYGIIVLALTQNSFYNSMRKYNIITIPLLAFYFIFLIRVGFEYAVFSTVLGNPIIALIFSEQAPLIDFVKSLF